MKMLTIEHMAMFVVKSIVIQINGQVKGPIECTALAFKFVSAQSGIRIKVVRAHLGTFRYSAAWCADDSAIDTLAVGAGVTRVFPYLTRLPATIA